MWLDLPYGAVLTVHLTAMLFSIGIVIVADTLGLLWFLGRIHTLSRTTLTWLHWLVVLGLTVSIVTGVLMFSTVSGFLLSQPAFYIKSALVGALIVNAYFIHHHIQLATEHPSTSLSLATKRKLLIFGTISTSSWVGILVASQFLGL